MTTADDYIAAVETASRARTAAVNALQMAINAEAAALLCASDLEFAKGDEKAGRKAINDAAFVRRTSAAQIVGNALSTGIGRKLFGLS